MKPNVLIVDDDAPWLEMMQKELEEYSASFSVIPAYDGKQALDVLEGGQVSIVVTDLRMPKMDGFELLSIVLSRYPDIPVIVITAYDRPKTREVVFKSGADDYMIKPFTAADLAEKIERALQKKSEGGSLHNVSLETFLQLIEMEQQTCTLRVFNKNSSKMGALFIRDGELMSARLGSRLGRDAAYEILSWSGVSVSIENRCPVTEKQLEGGLQAILLDAMRTKDESDEDFDPEEEGGEYGSSEKKPVKEKQRSNPGTDKKPISLTEPAQTAGSAKPGAAAGPAGDKSAMDSVRGKLIAAFGSEKGIEDIYEDPAWHYLIEQASNMGAAFEAGGLNAIYVNRGGNDHSVIVPGDQAVVIKMNPETSRDRIIDALM